MIPIELITLVLQCSTIFLFAGLGELLTERSGILNVGIEGIMLCGALTSVFVCGMTLNPWMGTLAAVGIGGLLGLTHAFLTVSLKVNQIISGIGIWIFGLGATTHFGRAITGPAKVVIEPIVGKLTPLFFIGIALVFILHFILFKTTFGLKLRSVGENPRAAEALGINVISTRYKCTVVGGLLMGLAGAYLALVYTLTWSAGMTAGRGWIAFALVFFSLWKPFILLFGSLLFALLWGAGFRIQGLVPSSATPLIQMVPYLVTVVVLILISSKKFWLRASAPAALGKPYIKEE